MPLPQELSIVTIGAHDVATLRAFYRAVGWEESPGATDDYAAFAVGSSKVAIYAIDRLRDEAAPAGLVPEPGRWNGVTLAVNVRDRETVDRVFHEVVAAGATAVASPRERDWGGYSGYVADPEGNRWEIAWAPPA